MSRAGGRLAGRTAIVTGAGAGIGAAIVQKFVGEGAFVGCLDVNVAAAEAVAEMYPGRCMALIADVVGEKSVDSAVTALVEKQKRLDVLVNNAGIAGPQSPVHTTALADWERTLQVNLTGPFLMARACIPHLLEQQGCIVNIASALALVGFRNECAYGSTKAGLVQLTKGMALDYAGRLRVNAVCPGAVRTPMIESVLPPGDDVEALLAEYGKCHPLHRRLASPGEIANAVLFLASDDASLMTGVALPVDAGLTAG